jgi:formylglycine-generating enzyme required for sulfatase activity
MNASIHRVLIVLVLAAPTAMALTIETVPVGDVGNGPDPFWLDSQGPLGEVAYEYRIGKYEVTNSQYAEFLNAKAASDPVALYDFDMGDDIWGGITRSGASGSYTYSVRPNMSDKAVNFVSMWSVLRFANWMHNGQGNGDTENGAYTLLGGNPSPTNTLQALVRNPGATWVLPTENEWYKAAYYDPRTEAAGGPPGDDHYWLYPTQSDDVPTMATANSVGEITNPGFNVANYGGGADWNGTIDGNVTTIGGAGPRSTTYYGTFDQAGNVAEWNHKPTGQPWSGLGGAFLSVPLLGDAQLLTAVCRNVASVSGLGPTTTEGFAGFRLVFVPEPSSLMLAALGLLVLVVCRCRLDAARAA